MLTCTESILQVFIVQVTVNSGVHGAYAIIVISNTKAWGGEFCCQSSYRVFLKKTGFFSCLCILLSCSFFLASLSNFLRKSVLLRESKCWSPSCEDPRTVCSVFESYPYVMNAISVFSAGERRNLSCLCLKQISQVLEKEKGYNS